jgi:hypothetical protein
MLHACFYTICFVFCYTSWHFYAFSRTNLLTRCHSASSLFSAVFVFQKIYTGNILRIGWNKSQRSYFSWHKTESKAETWGRPAGRRTIGWHSLPLARATRWCGRLAHLLTPSFRLYIFSSVRKPKTPDQFSLKYTASRCHRRWEIGRVQKLFPAPYRRGESPPEAFFITMPTSGVMCE